jgi:hypothetical protein
MMGPAFFLEEIFDLGNVVLDKDLTIVARSTGLEGVYKLDSGVEMSDPT